MRDYDRSNKNLDQEMLDKHLNRARKELLQALRVIDGLGIAKSAKRALERELRPLIAMAEQSKIKIPVAPVEELSDKKKKKDKKEVKGVNRRRKESK